MTGIAQAFFMGYGQGGEWTPASLFASSEAGCWFDPSDLTTMWTDDGTTQAGVGDAVYRIDDKSGNGNHARQTTEANRPILRQDVSGNYYLEFDGTNDSLITGNIDLSSSTRVAAYFAADSDRTDGGTIRPVIMNAASGTEVNSFAIYFPHSTTSRDLAWSMKGAASNQNFLTYSGAIYSSPIVVGSEFQADGGSEAGRIPVTRINGAGVSTTTEVTGVDAASFENKPFRIGIQEANSYCFDGALYGLVVRNADTTSDQANLEAYLAAKAGVTL